MSPYDLDKYQNFAEEQLGNWRQIDALIQKLNSSETLDPKAVIAEIAKLKQTTEHSMHRAEKNLQDLQHISRPVTRVGQPENSEKRRPVKPTSPDNHTNPQLRLEIEKIRADSLRETEKMGLGSHRSNPEDSACGGKTPSQSSINIIRRTTEKWLDPRPEKLEEQKAALAKAIISDKEGRNKWNEFKLNSLRNSIVSVSSNENNNPLHSPKQGLPVPGKQQASSRFEGSDGNSVTSIRSRGLKVDDNVILQLSTPVRVHRVGEEKAVAGPQPQQPLPEKKTSCPELPFDSARNEGDPGETNSGRQGSLSSQLKLQLRNLSECLSKDRAIAAESKGQDIDWVQDLSADVPSAEKLDEASVMPVENESVYSPDTISHKISEYSERKLGFKPARLSNFEGLTIEIETPDPEPSHSALLEKIKSPPELSLRQLGSPKEIGKKIAREMSMKAAEFNAELITSEVMTLLFDELMMDGFVLRELFKLQMESTPRGIKTNIRAVKRYLAKLCEYIKGSLPLTQTPSRLTS